MLILFGFLFLFITCCPVVHRGSFQVLHMHSQRGISHCRYLHLMDSLTILIWPSPHLQEQYLILVFPHDSLFAFQALDHWYQYHMSPHPMFLCLQHLSLSHNWSWRIHKSPVLILDMDSYFLQLEKDGCSIGLQIRRVPSSMNYKSPPDHLVVAIYVPEILKQYSQHNNSCWLFKIVHHSNKLLLTMHYNKLQPG